MKVPFLQLDRLHASLRGDLQRAFESTVSRSSFVGSSAVAGFEEEFAEAHGRRFAASCGSGTDALALVLRAAGIGPGDEVVVPAMTFVATAEAVCHCGATPVLADSGPDLLINRETVDSARTDATKAVMPVHLYGHIVPPWRSPSACGESPLVIEDAAQAHLGEWQGRPIGESANAVCFSFYPGKNLGALGDGGMVLSDDPSLIETVKRIRDHGRSTKYEHAQLGWCSRLDGLQAAFLSVKLHHLAEWTERRRVIASRYLRLLEKLPDQLLSVVPWSDGAVHHLFPVRVPARSRDGLRLSLQQQGIETGIHYPIPLSKQPSMRLWSRPCPVAELGASQLISLPIDPMMSDAEVDYVCDRLSVAVLQLEGLSS